MTSSWHITASHQVHKQHLTGTLIITHCEQHFINTRHHLIEVSFVDQVLPYLDVIKRFDGCVYCMSILTTQHGTTGFNTIMINTFSSSQNGHHLADESFNRDFLDEKVRISISLAFVPYGPIDNTVALVQTPSHYLNQWWPSLLSLDQAKWRIFASIN